MAIIVVTSGKQEGEYLPLGRRTSVIGRAENLPFQILDDMVSYKHLRIHFRESEGRYYAEDMDSRHGIFINNFRITSETALSEGDQIQIGQTTLLFTDKYFDDRESALMHYKKIGECDHRTVS
jgi:pSer/pThr/pTyr-binding forkhead associated (FHA) protein